MKTLILGLLVGLTFSAQANYRCTTSSNGLRFAGKGQTRTEASRSTVSRCTRANGTDRAECRLNLNCQGGGTVYVPPPVVTPRVSCNTESNGLFFSEQGRNVWNVKQAAISSCQRSYQTTSFECSVNVSCNDGSYTAPMVRCQTRSNGQVFSDESRDQWQTRDHVIETCQHAWNTNYYQCRDNVLCGSDIYTQPVRPVVNVRTRIRNVATQIQELTEEVELYVGYWTNETYLEPLNSNAQQVINRLNNGAPNRRLKNAMERTVAAMADARFAIDNVYSYSQRVEFDRKLNRLETRLNNLISQL